MRRIKAWWQGSPLKQTWRQLSPATFLRNVWAYRGVLWTDQDWDESYLFALLERKLRRMAEHFMTHDLHANRLSIARQLVITAECCRRLCEDAYEDLPYERHSEKWGEIDLTINRQVTQHPHVFCSRPGVLTEEDHVKERAENDAIWRHVEYLRQQDLETIGAMLRRHALQWWC